MKIFIQYGMITEEYKVEYNDFGRVKQGILKRLGNISASKRAEKERTVLKRRIKESSTMDDFIFGIGTTRWRVWVEEMDK
jgi:hypothetical protein